MTMRITISTGDHGVEIHLEGRLEALGVPDLRDACRSAGSAPQLDLSGLRSADEIGVDALRSLRAKGAKLRGASPHIRQLLKSEEP